MYNIFFLTNKYLYYIKIILHIRKVYDMNNVKIPVYHVSPYDF